MTFFLLFNRYLTDDLPGYPTDLRLDAANGLIETGADGVQKPDTGINGLADGFHPRFRDNRRVMGQAILNGIEVSPHLVDVGGTDPVHVRYRSDGQLRDFDCSVANRINDGADTGKS
jgi:hypothetical protein